TDAQKRDYITKGVEAADKALAIKTDFVEALTFKGLLLRQQALVEKDPAKQQELVKQGTALGDKANELRKAQQKSTTDSANRQAIRRYGNRKAGGESPMAFFRCRPSIIAPTDLRQKAFTTEDAEDTEPYFRVVRVSGFSRTRGYGDATKRRDAKKGRRE